MLRKAVFVCFLASSCKDQGDVREAAVVRDAASDFVAAGPEAEFVILVSNSCQACRSPAFQNELASRMSVSRNRLQHCGFRATYTGISVDPREADARSILRAMGPFDRISTGRSWLAAAASGLPPRTPLAVPRLVLFAHWVSVDTASVSFARTSVVADEVGAQQVVSDTVWQAIVSQLCGLGR
jgi:hypothetical protein